MYFWVLACLRILSTTDSCHSWHMNVRMRLLQAFYCSLTHSFPLSFIFSSFAPSLFVMWYSCCQYRCLVRTLLCLQIDGTCVRENSDSQFMKRNGDRKKRIFPLKKKIYSPTFMFFQTWMTFFYGTLFWRIVLSLFFKKLQWMRTEVFNLMQKHHKSIIHVFILPVQYSKSSEAIQ